jgi:NADH-quinone oxidoreductase subunit H
MSDPINLIANWFENLLLGWGLAEGLTAVILQTIGAAIIASACMAMVVFLIWYERKLAARLQDRLGPNRAGPFGLFQPIADVIKLFTKEDITPLGADKVIFNIAPVLSVASVLLIWAVLPFASTLVGTDINVGVLYISAVGSFGILSILMAGWSSNNKFALLGAFRAVAQLISYEVPLFMALLVPVLLARTMGIGGIIASQGEGIWFIFLAPVSAFIFFVASMAEVGRAPFDLLEAESEIVAGYNVEYSSMKFGMFFVSEFLHQFTVGALLAILFFGGWRGPGAEQWPILGMLYFVLKIMIAYTIITWVRLTVPRIRIDQMLSFCWKFLTPLSLVTLMVTAILDKLLNMAAVSGLVYGLSMFAANVVIIWATAQIYKKAGKPTQRQEFAPRPVAVPPTDS